MDHLNHKNHNCCEDGGHSAMKRGKPETARDIVYTCPMHPEVVQNHPGMCPECGMNLVPLQASADKHYSSGHDKHQGHKTNVFKTKFWISLILTIPVFLSADIFTVLTGWSPIKFPGAEYLSLAMGSVIFFYGGWVFLIGAWREVRGRLPGMMTLIGIAISTAYVWSAYAVFSGAEPLFWELTSLITIMLLGHWLEMRAVSGAQGALRELSKLLPDEAEVQKDGKTEKISLEKLREGDVILIRPGSKIPADGRIIDGKSDVNESMITGESGPVRKAPGDLAIAGTVNGQGALKVEVSKVGEKTFLAGVMRLVAEAQSSKSRLQILSDRAAFYLTFIAVGGGIATLGAWLAVGADVGFAVARLVAVLVIACPHALGLAVPLVASITTTKAAQNGFLIKQRLALESAREIDTVLFDKTGTLTEGRFGVVDVWSVGGFSREDVLYLAACVDSVSEHPIAKAIVDEAADRRISISEPVDFEAIKGKGVRGIVDGSEIAVGGPALVETLEVKIPEKIETHARQGGVRGQTVVFVFKEKKLAGALALADVVRKESKEAVEKLKAMGVQPVMITGDSKEVAAWVSSELGIDEYFARVLPHQKSEKMKELQGRGLKVAMVGDGINDAPALVTADLGIAIGAGTNVAIESAGIILVKNDPRDIVKIFRLSRKTYKKMIQNLFWAAGYNVVALPLAAGILAFKGILLQPALAAIFMSASTVIVAINALLLRREKI